MKSSLQQILEDLDSKVIKVDGVSTGTVKLEDASELLQILEVKILNEYGHYPNKQEAARAVSKDKGKIVKLGKGELNPLSGAGSPNGGGAR